MCICTIGTDVTTTSHLTARAIAVRFQRRVTQRTAARKAATKAASQCKMRALGAAAAAEKSAEIRARTAVKLQSAWRKARAKKQVGMLSAVRDIMGEEAALVFFQTQHGSVFGGGKTEEMKMKVKVKASCFLFDELSDEEQQQQQSQVHLPKI